MPRPVDAVESMQAAAVRARDGLVRDELAQIQDPWAVRPSPICAACWDCSAHEDAAILRRRCRRPRRSAVVGRRCHCGGLGPARGPRGGDRRPRPPPSASELAVLATALGRSYGERPHHRLPGRRVVHRGGHRTSCADDRRLLVGDPGAAVGVERWARPGSARAWAALGRCSPRRVSSHVHLYAPGNEPIEVAFYAWVSFAGHLWAERERAERAALAEVNRLSADTSAVVVARRAGGAATGRARAARCHQPRRRRHGGPGRGGGGPGRSPIRGRPAMPSARSIGPDPGPDRARRSLARILAQDPAPRTAVGEPAATSATTLLALIGRMRAGGLRITLRPG